MVQLSAIESQLAKLGVRKTFFCKPEIRELQHILMEGEEISKFVNGRYHGGFAILVATSQRLLMIDKRPLYLTVEDVRYDMISEIDISARLLDATVTIFTVNKKLIFSAVRQQHLRDLSAYVQHRVMEMRQYHPEATQQVQYTQPQMSYAQSAPLPLPDSSIHQINAHIPHVPEPVSQVVTRTRAHIPHHLSYAVGSSATKLASRLHNPNPYSRNSLVVKQSWSNFS